MKEPKDFPSIDHFTCSRWLFIALYSYSGSCIIKFEYRGKVLILEINQKEVVTYEK